MAIDFMIMPLSRYLSGDFVTPMMRLAWEQGIPYAVYGAGGKKDCPPDTPFGGPGAPEHRASILGMLTEDLAQLPAPIPSQLWDERASTDPKFHRVDPGSLSALLEAAATPVSRLFGLVKRDAATHLHATLFLPCRFGDAVAMQTPLERRVGSVPVALEQLAARTWPNAAAAAAQTLRAALADAAALRLPMIVDT